MRKVIQGWFSEIFGKRFSLETPAYSPDIPITGCDTTSFMFSVGKVKDLKKCMKQVQKVSLLNRFAKTLTVDFKVSQNSSKFI